MAKSLGVRLKQNLINVARSTESSPGVKFEQKQKHCNYDKQVSKIILIETKNVVISFDIWGETESCCDGGRREIDIFDTACFCQKYLLNSKTKCLKTEIISFAKNILLSKNILLACVLRSCSARLVGCRHNSGPVPRRVTQSFAEFREANIESERLEVFWSPGQRAVRGGNTEKKCWWRDIAQQQPRQSCVELETKVHPKVRNHGEGPY